MHPHPFECFICGADEEWTLLVCRQAAKESQVCVRCLHALIHGMHPDEIRRRMRQIRGEDSVFEGRPS